MSNQLIIAPHIDDDILGCGGILNNKSTVVYCGVDDFHVVDRETRLEEANSAAKVLGHNWKILHGNQVNYYVIQDLIDEFSKTINTMKPDSIYIPYPSYNQDHVVVYNAAIIALRPHDINYFVPNVFIYEQPHVFFWDQQVNTNGFKPNYFCKIDINKKILAYQKMQSQVRPFRSSDHLLSLAKLRGGQCNCDHAEAFQAIRIVKQ